MKTRILGDFGHLNNGQAAKLIELIASDRLHTVVACHISETNNEVALVKKALESVLEIVRLNTWSRRSRMDLIG